MSTTAKEEASVDISKGTRVFLAIRKFFIYCLSFFIIFFAVFFAASKSPNKSLFGFRYYIVLTDSMVPEFSSGDMVFVRQCETASNGEIVVALIEDSATVKTFYKERGHIRLQPENDTMEPIIVDDCQHYRGEISYQKRQNLRRHVAVA